MKEAVSIRRLQGVAFLWNKLRAPAPLDNFVSVHTGSYEQRRTLKILVIAEGPALNNDRFQELDKSNGNIGLEE